MKKKIIIILMFTRWRLLRIIFLPHATKLGKVMFLDVTVIFSTGGLSGKGYVLQGGVHGRWGWQWGVEVRMCQ